MSTLKIVSQARTIPMLWILTRSELSQMSHDRTDYRQLKLLLWFRLRDSKVPLMSQAPSRRSTLPQPSVKTDTLSYRSTSRMPGRCVCPCLVHFTWREFLSAHASLQQTVKRSDETHEFCKISYSLPTLTTLTDHARPMRLVSWLYRVSGASQFSPSI